MQKKNNHWDRSSSSSLRRLLTLLLAAAVCLQTAWPARAQKGISATPPRQEQSVYMLRDALKSKKVSLKVQGDGVTTSEVTVLLTNHENVDITVLIPRFEIFHPGASAGVQKMMATADTMAFIPVGSTIDFKVPTVCADVKTVAPPTNQQAEFSAGPYGSTPEELKIWQQLAATVLAAQELGRQQAYSKLPIGKALSAQSQIMQLAIWRLLGMNSTNPENKVTSEAISNDLFKAMAAAAKQNPDLLKMLTDGGAKFSPSGELIPSREQKKNATQNSDAIFAAIDLTVNRSQAPNIANVVVPKTSWDGYYDVGMRTYENGDFTESAELLEAARNDAKDNYGEADDRYSKSLVGMGVCYSDFGNLDGAEPILTEALQIRQKVHGKDSVEVAEVDNDLGLVKQRKDLFDPAEELFNNGLAIATKAATATGKLVSKLLNNLGRNYCLKNDAAAAQAAIPKLQQAMVISLQNNPSEKTPELAEIETNLADAYAQSGDLAKASKFYEQADSIARDTLGADHPYLATILSGRAELAKKSGDLTAAETYTKEAEKLASASFGKESKSLQRYPASYDAQKRFQLYCVGTNRININKAKLMQDAAVFKAPSSERAAVSRAVKDKWALVIGISKYQDSSINLRYSAKDAQDFANYLIETQHFARDHVHVLTDAAATQKNIKSELGDKFLARVAQPDDLVVIYLSGHGSPSKVDVRGANYFVAYDTDKNELYGSGIEMKSLYSMIKDRVRCERTVFMLDACHSGAITGAKGLFKVLSFDANEIAQGSGTLVLCSSQPDEVSWESKRYQNGVFTHYLMDSFGKTANMKLKDALDLVKDNVAAEVLRDRGETQHPVVSSRWVGDDLVLGAPPAKPREGMAQDPKLSSSGGADASPAAKSVKPTTVKSAAATVIKSTSSTVTKATGKAVGAATH